jgi:glyoxylase-like metal-dependent hydrolase (beta-lactamase superfamily II)
MDVVAVRPDLTMIVEPPAQAYLLRHDGGVLLVDTGMPGLGAATLDVLRGQALTHIVLTHRHVDHAGSAAEIAALTGAPVYAGRADAPLIRSGEAGPQPVFTATEEALFARVGAGLPAAPPPCRVDVELDDGDRIDELGAVVVATPGHTDGSIALHLPDTGVLFTGDVAAESEGRVVLGPFNTGRARATASFRRFADLAADTVCFGHGRPLRDDDVGLLHDAAAADVVPDPLG